MSDLATIEKIADKIISNLNDRSGIEMDGFDDEIQEEIRDEIVETIVDGLAGS